MADTGIIRMKSVPAPAVFDLRAVGFRWSWIPAGAAPVVFRVAGERPAAEPPDPPEPPEPPEPGPTAESR
jgi:hypothetical protein